MRSCTGYHLKWLNVDDKETIKPEQCGNDAAAQYIKRGQAGLLKVAVAALCSVAKRQLKEGLSKLGISDYRGLYR